MPPTQRRIIFLDRDGTLNHDPGYITEPGQFHLIEGAVEAVRLLQPHYALVLVSNQSGISRGFFTHDHVARVMTHLEALLAEADARLDAIHYCPHQKTDGCDCRKPEPGMLRRAAADLGLALDGAWMVGDRSSDIEAGRAVDARTILLPEPLDAPPLVAEPDYRCPNLLDAARLILKTDGYDG